MKTAASLLAMMGDQLSLTRVFDDGGGIDSELYSDERISADGGEEWRRITLMEGMSSIERRDS